jgi:hypothetical protein
LKLELRSFIYRQKAVNFNSHLKTFYVEFRFEFYIKIKPIDTKILYLPLYILEIDSSVFKSVQISSIFSRLVQKIKKTISCCQREPAFSVVQCWHNYEYFMLKQCLENIGEVLLHACISSKIMK